MATQVAGRKMFLAGEWVNSDRIIEVRDPQDNSIIDTVPAASAEDMLKCIEAAKEGAKIAAAMSVHERMEVINKAADYIEANKEKYARTIAQEGSKTIREATKEVARCIQTLRISGEEARYHLIKCQEMRIGSGIIIEFQSVLSAPLPLLMTH